MSDPARDAASVVDLLTRYSFDLSGYTVDRLAEYWLQRYPADWIRLAVVEALYQGRYKVVSVEQILNLWGRRGKPLYHFNPDFERIITPRFNRGRTVQPDLIVLPPAPSTPELESIPEAMPNLTPGMIEISRPELDKPNPPRPREPRPAGAIQPFSVSGFPLPGEAIIRGFYHQILEAAPPEQEADSADFPEAELLEGELLEADLEALNDEPVFFPESSSVEFKPTADAAIGELPIPTFKPSGDESLNGALEAAPTVNDLLSSTPIHQFVPTPPPSEFYAKLKAIVQNAAASKLAKNALISEIPLNPPSKGGL